MSESSAHSILEALGPARRFADPTSPPKARLMAAGGGLPLPPAQVAGVLVALTFDPEEAIRAKAEESLSRLPDSVVDQVLAAEVPGAVLEWFAHTGAENEGRLEKIALNAATSDATYCFLASLAFPRILDIVAGNQVRLLRCAQLVDTLGGNSLTPQSTIDRILHFLGVERAESEEPIAVNEAEQAPTPPEPADADELDDLPLDLDDGSDLPPELTEETDEPESDDVLEEAGSLLSRVQEMSVMEKIKLARFGNAEARGILVRDRNRIVATSAIRSPKITEQEVAAFAKSRNLCDDVYRIIAANRDWTRNYQVKLGLTLNPKTPQATALKLLNYLTDRDLRQTMRSREVPSVISQGARRLLMKKGKL